MGPSHRPDQSENGEASGDRTTRADLPDLGDGRYLIQELVGEGGMGYVYRAVDRQLDRTVAIKAIRPSLASKPEVVKRLAREAKFAAQLDHPFICKVHELIHRDDGQAFLVMEYVEGETLKAVLKTVPLDLSSVVRLARELADALSFAHQRGLLHRDIKPGNVIMTLHGHIKVMDFGVAKALDVDFGTMSTLTEHGHVVGTPAYMSPEQAAGESVDHRSDIFSFGVLLYECISGHLPFEGSTAAAYLRQAALGQPQPLPRHVPAELRAIVLKCLAKSPADRYENFDAVRKDLDAASLSLISAESHLTFSQRLRLGPRPWLMAVLLGVLVVGGYFVIDSLQPAEGQPRLLVQRPIVTWPSVENGSRISPDGTAVAFISNQGGQRLWVRSARGTEPTAITPVREALKTPAWSADGRQIAHLVRNDGRAWLQIISLWGESAGQATPIGGAWDDVALVRWIGNRIYFSVSAGSSPSTLWRRDTTTGADEQLTHASGRRFSVTGQTVNVDVRRDESRIVFAGEPPEAGLWVSDLDGRNAERLPVAPNSVVTPRWRGPGGRSIAYVTNENGQTDIWEYKVDRKTRTPLTTSPLEEESIDISADGDMMVADTRDQAAHLWAADPGAPSTAVQITNDGRSDLWPSVSPQSGRVLFHRRQGSFVVYTPDDTEILTSRWQDRRLLEPAVLGTGAAGGLSADGRRAYFLQWTGAHPNEPEFWVRDLDSPNPPRKIWDRSWFPGNHIETWAPLAQTAVWNPRDSSDLYFVRRAGAGEFVSEVVRTRLAADLSPNMTVLATSKGEERFLDLAVSDDGAALALVAASRRPYRGGAVLLADPGQTGGTPRTIFTATEGAQLYARGWTRRGTVVVLKSLRPDRENSTEVWEVDPNGASRRIALIPGLLGMTARLDPARDRLFATVVEQGHATVRALSLPGGAATTVVANDVDGVMFGGYSVAPDGWLLFMRKQTNNDVWLFDFADRQSGSTSQGGKKQ